MTEDEVKNELKRLGDLGLVVEELGKWENSFDLSLNQVYEKLAEMEETSGLGSQEKKQDQVYEILKQLHLVIFFLLFFAKNFNRPILPVKSRLHG